MGSHFDDIARALATETSRRRALRRVVLIVAGGLGLALSGGQRTETVAAVGVPGTTAPPRPRQRPIFNQICFNQIVFNQTCPPDETPPGDDPNPPDTPRPLTSTQRRQKERTNTGSPDDDRLEGNVVAVNPDAQPPTITVANVDGDVVVELMGDAAKVARAIKVGDYVEAYGEKEHELLFRATDLSVDD